MDARDLLFLLLALTLLLFVLFCLLGYWLLRQSTPIRLRRFAHNPVLRPDPEHWWESEAVFNPAAMYEGGRVHLLYRALGRDGISRIGYASSKDGVHFDERLAYPVYEPTRGFGIPDKNRIYGPLSYSQTAYASGGGWGGAEDPRMVRIGSEVYITFTAFDGWGFVRMALTSTPIKNFMHKTFNWAQPALISPPNEMHKNWVLFPEKIGGRYAILHGISPDIRIEYIDDLADLYRPDLFIQSGPPKAAGPASGTIICAALAHHHCAPKRGGSCFIMQTMSARATSTNSARCF
jgi:hypothetical protein